MRKAFAHSSGISARLVTKISTAEPGLNAWLRNPTKFEPAAPAGAARALVEPSSLRSTGVGEFGSGSGTSCANEYANATRSKTETDIARSGSRDLEPTIIFLHSRQIKNCKKA